MTNAIDLAAEALQRAKKSLCNWTPRYRFIDDALIDLDKALAALTAEQSRVPLDRERLAKRLEEAATDGWPFSPEMSHPLDCSDLVEATTLLRQPVAAEVEALFNDIDVIFAEAFLEDTQADFGRSAEQALAGFNKVCTFLRRLSFPAVGEWRPTHRHHKGGLYREVARGRWEADLSPVVIYDNDYGETWVRPVADFDGWVTPPSGDLPLCPRFKSLLLEETGR